MYAASDIILFKLHRSVDFCGCTSHTVILHSATEKVSDSELRAHGLLQPSQIHNEFRIEMSDTWKDKDTHTHSIPHGTNGTFCTCLQYRMLIHNYMSLTVRHSSWRERFKKKVLYRNHTCTPNCLLTYSAGWCGH